VINNPPERLADGDVVKLSSEENAQGVPGAQKAGIK
jgi:hypothetical protein